MHDVHGQAEREHGICTIIGIDGKVLFERSALSGGIYARLDLPDSPGIQVIRTNHRGGTASGRHDAVNDQRLVARITYLENMAHLGPLGDFS